MICCSAHGDVEKLVVAGVTTSGVALSTLCRAADSDFRLRVLSDGCKNHDEEVQRVLMDKVLTMQALVTTTAAWSEGVGQGNLTWPGRVSK